MANPIEKINKPGIHATTTAIRASSLKLLNQLIIAHSPNYDCTNDKQE